MNKLLKHALLVCGCLFALTGHAIVELHAIPVESTTGAMADAERAYVRGDFEKAGKLYRPLAEKGVTDAQFILGSMYDLGVGVARDYPEALKWFRLAAEQGNVKAQSKLGAMYDIGLEVAQDRLEAMKWWLLAAEQGDVFAQYNLGVIYDHGRVVPKDFRKALKWYRMAAEQGNVFAQEKLAWKYILGQGVPQDDELAYMWLDIAISNDHTPGWKMTVKQRLQHRDAVARGMTARQIEEARELARKCTANKFRGCGQE